MDIVEQLLERYPIKRRYNSEESELQREIEKRKNLIFSHVPKELKSMAHELIALQYEHDRLIEKEAFRHGCRVYHKLIVDIGSIADGGGIFKEDIWLD